MNSKATLLWCRNRDCRVGFASAGEVPRQCPYCHSYDGWTTDAPVPLTPYELTLQDVAFLFIQGIDPA